MSAANRGTVRLEHDKYATPSWLVRAFLPFFPKGEGPLRVLEPACGSGVVVREVESYLAPRLVEVVSFDVEPENNDCPRVDFLSLEPDPSFDVIITNPPYTLGFEFVQHALKFRRNEESLVVMLLRLNWLGSKKRAPWLRRNTPSIYVTPRRPSFRGLGTDATEYAWFVWDGKTPTVHILDTDLPELAVVSESIPT